ncbi:MAG TPA: TldD/PmbA family protein [Phycisphaerae bacterium]|nr:TldD/PmbA family protein [Phycisphaerae bacterium]
MKDRLVEALKASTADYAEIRFEAEDRTRLSYRGEEVENVSSSKRAGGLVRACTRGGWASAAFDTLEDLEHQVAEACRCAELVGRESTQLAEPACVAHGEHPARMDRDFRGVPLDEKLKLIAGYNDVILRADDAIESSYVTYFDKFRTVHFASTRGAYFMEQRPQVGLAFVAVARDGSLVQRAHDGVSSAVTYDTVLDRDEDIAAVAGRAVDLLTAPPCEGGQYTVVLDQELGGVFVHEAFGHLSEADFLYENPKMRDLMHLGRRMGVEELNIVDDGALGRTIGTHAYDDEGTPTGKTPLITDGVLTAHLHSLETAAKMGEKPTGNARAIGRGYEPIVRMTNTYVAGGKIPFDELIAGIDDGLYAKGMFGGQTMMEMFTFSAAYGYRIRKGRLAELIRDVVLTGNVFETLHAMDGFGDDFEICEKTGGCGKGGQAPLPVTFGSPHLRIRNVVVGGR